MQQQTKKVCRTNARYTASYYAREHVDINKGLAAVLVAAEEEDPSLLSQMQEPNISYNESWDSTKGREKKGEGALVGIGQLVPMTHFKSEHLPPNDTRSRGILGNKRNQNQCSASNGLAD